MKPTALSISDRKFTVNIQEYFCIESLESSSLYLIYPIPMKRYPNFNNPEKLT
jgi:hypothetical protein